MDKKFGDQPSNKSLINPKNTTRYTPLEFYQLLLPLEMGKPIKADELSKAQEMKKFLTDEFGHDKIQHVDEEELKKKINGEALIDRLKYRKQIGLLSIGKKAIV